MRRRGALVTLFVALGVFVLLSAFEFKTPVDEFDNRDVIDSSPSIESRAQMTIETGRKIFRFDTFGDEEFWGGDLRLHEAIAGRQHGGVGHGLSPKAALEAGLKVDVDALPHDLQNRIRHGKVDLDDPATTLALMKLNAVVGVKGFFHGNRLSSMGIQCALCHSTVDNSFAPGIGHRLDGWANRDLNVGAIVAMAPDLSPFADLLGVSQSEVRDVLRTWGPGKFDAALMLDGKAFRADGKSGAVLIPPAFGLAGVNLHTWTGWGGVTHWNALVANLEMHGKGTFYDPRLDNVAQFPVAAAHNLGHVASEPDLITPKLAALQFYQLALPAPKPPSRLFDRAAAERGDRLFEGKAKCATCHVDPIYSEPGWNMHTADEIGVDDFQADRAPDHAYRTTPLKGLWTHMKGGFYHDGRFATLLDVVNHYNEFFNLGLSSREKRDVVEYLKSLGDVPVSAFTGEASEAFEATMGDSVSEAGLGQNVPNPFNPSTVIRYQMNRPGHVVLDVFSVNGELVKRLVDAPQETGSYAVPWDGSNEQGQRVASGMYFYQLRAGNVIENRKMLLLK